MTTDIIGIYFDYFGTLIDQNYAVTNVWSRITKKLGKEIAWDDPRILKGMQKQYEEYLKLGKLYVDLSEEEWNSINVIVLDSMGFKIEGSSINISEEFHQEFRTGSYKHRLYPGCRETLKQIKARNIKIGLHTHAAREPCQLKMKELKIFEFFDIFIHTGDFGYNKSNIEIYQIALDAMKARSPTKIFHVGDNLELDVKMAQKVGMTPILFDPDKKYSLNDIRVISELPEVLKFL